MSHASFHTHVARSHDIDTLCQRAASGETLETILRDADPFKDNPGALIQIAMAVSTDKKASSANYDSHEYSSDEAADSDLEEMLDDLFNSKSVIFDLIWKHASPRVRRIQRFIKDLFFLQIDKWQLAQVDYESEHSMIVPLRLAGLLDYPESKPFIMQANAYIHKKAVQQSDGNTTLEYNERLELMHPWRVIHLKHLLEDKQEDVQNLICDDEELLSTFAYFDRDVLEYASDRLCSDKDFVVECVANYGYSELYHLYQREGFDDLRNDPDVVKAAILGPARLQDFARQKNANDEANAAAIYYHSIGGKQIGYLNAMTYIGEKARLNADLIFELIHELSERDYGEHTLQDFWTYKVQNFYSMSPKYRDYKVFMEAMARLRNERRHVDKITNIPDDIQRYLVDSHFPKDNIDTILALFTYDELRHLFTNQYQYRFPRVARSIRRNIRRRRRRRRQSQHK